MAFLTQAEAEARLVDLRERRDALDRTIADCLAFLELGRRLQSTDPVPADPVITRAPGYSDEVEAGTSVSIRRRGRAMIMACVAILREAQRPMHAGEILERLLASGFAVPGADPVASLNTRLWKRSGADGPFRRLGDAVYDLTRAGDAPSPGANDREP